MLITHLIQNPRNPLFISYQCPECNTWNCFNFVSYTVIITIPTKPMHMCRKCNSENKFDTYTAADIILRKHNIKLDTKSVNYNIELTDKILELIKFYEILGSAQEKPNPRKFSYNPFDDMFKD